ncbi:phosphatase PAP2 family protein [Clostridium pasteurianum]|uniref:Membrane-associated phospholipid phosphatase n=1 Tax=Clostridium pasteurianum BC1 TaxID=86416 RepID=R4K3E2_CLOPA|nr:phosphatase PAP2 family protein [Clostridium pasteurianum]AGK96256.1 membrane-associated phospholipid phosphatase [Clostridium pasteurianum BC1]
MYLNILNRINIFDNYVLHSINKYLKNKYLDKLMPIVTAMGNVGIIWIAVAIILLLNRPYRTIGDIVILTLFVSTIVGEGIVKHIVKRIRPCNNGINIHLLISRPISYSFPSGHTSSSFAVAGVLSMYFHQYRIIFMSVAFLIALSRLYLYVHYPTDIIGGIIIGILCSKSVFIILNIISMQNIHVPYKIY